MNRKPKSANLLCIFSRYPQEGQCKTRLIPELGAKGAASLQQRMSDHIIDVAQQVDSDVLLFVKGGSGRKVDAWLQGRVAYLFQEGDDIGMRMANCFKCGFAQGYERIVLVGADCPALDAELLTQAMDALANHDLVFGPSLDGGYYLVGMNEFQAQIFAPSLNWGTGEVLAQTRAVVKDRQVKLLPALRDMDSPEDLEELPEFLQVSSL